MADFEDRIPSEAEEELEAVVETEQGIAKFLRTLKKIFTTNLDL